MMTKIIKVDSEYPDSHVIKKVAKEIKLGKIVVYPTETCYGLGTNALNKKAVNKIYRIKEEPTKSNLIAIVSDLKIAKKFGKINKTVEKVVKKFMPGPLTVIVRKKKIYPQITNRAFAFRISSNKIAHLLAKYSGVPITATSANVHGQPSIYSSKEIIEKFYGKVDIILDVGNLKRIKPSTIVDLREKKPKLIREGPVPFKEVARFLELEG